MSYTLNLNKWRYGGTGRHTGFKIQRIMRVGSSPTIATSKKGGENLSNLNFEVVIIVKF